MIKLTRVDIIEMHNMLADATGGSRGLKDNGLLDLSLNSPFATFAGEDLYPTIEEKAAKLAYGLINNHPFIDGNKRIGILAMLTFLELNDTSFEITDSALIDLTIGIADGSVSNKDLVDIIMDYSTPVLGDYTDVYLKRRGLDKVLPKREFEELKDLFQRGEISKDDIAGIIQLHNYKLIIKNNM